MSLHFYYGRALMAFSIIKVDKKQKRMWLMMVMLLAGVSAISPVSGSLNEADWDDLMPGCCCGSALLPMACAGLHSRRAIIRIFSVFLDGTRIKKPFFTE
jgi:hypothetical protein